MASLESARLLIAEAKGIVLVLMQEGDVGDEIAGGYAKFINQDWADRMFEAYTSLHNALEYLDEAERYS